MGYRDNSVSTPMRVIGSRISAIEKGTSATAVSALVFGFPELRFVFIGVQGNNNMAAVVVCCLKSNALKSKQSLDTCKGLFFN